VPPSADVFAIRLRSVCRAEPIK